MTNGDKIRLMTNEELADYAKSLYIAGQLKVQCGLNSDIDREIDYLEWLSKPVIEE